MQKHKERIVKTKTNQSRIKDITQLFNKNMQKKLKKERNTNAKSYFTLSLLNE